MNSLLRPGEWDWRKKILRWCSMFWRKCPEYGHEHRNGSIQNQRRRENRTVDTHVPANGDDPGVRRTGKRALYAGADAGAGAPLYRRRSGGGRSLRSAAQGRLHYEHAPWAWTLRGERSFAGPNVCGVAGERSGLLPGQGRVDAHRRSGDGKFGSERDRGGQRGDCHGSGAFLEKIGNWTSGGVLFRGRSAGAGSSLRGYEPGGALEIAGDLRLRE